MYEELLGLVRLLFPTITTLCEKLIQWILDLVSAVAGVDYHDLLAGTD